MIIRKTITTIIASLISMTFLLIVIFDEGLGIDFVNTVLFTIVMFSPIILLYGVPVTFISDYATKRFTGVKRVLLALIFHLFFGMIFPFLYSLIEEMSSFETKTIFIGATTFAFFFWAIDEISRRVLLKSAVMDYEEQRTIKFKHWLNSFIVLLIVSLSAFTINSFVEANAIANHSRSSLNWDAVIIANILYSLVLALLFSPIGYLVIKTVLIRKN
jgi:hypothetical protein